MFILVKKMSTNRYSAFDIIEQKSKSSRQLAYEILSNKDNIKKQLYKTKMCNKINCTNKYCQYAHTKDELRPLMCFFGDAFIYKNSKNKPCNMVHPSDTFTKEQPKTCIFIKKLV